MNTPIYMRRHEAPSYRQIRAFRWQWTVRDGMTGPVLATGHTLTAWGARRRIEHVTRRCVCIDGVCRCDNPVLKPLTAMDAYALSDRLQRDGIPVTVRIAGPDDAQIVQLWPALALTPRQEAHTLHLVAKETDMPVRWAGAIW